jgi:hypothetical protein
MILIDDNLRFILSIRFNDDGVRFYNLTEINFDNRFSPGNDIASLAVVWKFDRIR